MGEGSTVRLGSEFQQTESPDVKKGESFEINEIVREETAHAGRST